MKSRLIRFLNDQELLVLVSLVVVSFLIGLTALHLFHFVGSDGGGDSAGYALVGKNLFSGKGYSIRGGPELIHPPLYPIFIGAFWLLSGNLEFSGQLVSVIATCLLVIPVYYLAKSMWGRKVALVCAGFTVVFPALVYGATEIRAEALYTLLIMSSVALTWKALRVKGLFWAFLAGLTTGLAYLTHPIGVIFIPIFLTFFFFSRFFTPRPTKISILTKVGLLLAGFILISSPYWAFLHRHTGKWILSGNTAYAEFYRTQTLRGNVERDSFMFSEEPSWMKHRDSEPSESMAGVLGFVLSHPGELFKIMGENLISIYPRIAKDAERVKIPPPVWKITLISLVLLILIGFVKAIWDKRITVKEIYLIVILLSASVFLLFHIEARYFFPYTPVFLMGLGKVAVDIQERLRKATVHRATVLLSIIGWIIPGVLFLGMISSSTYLILKKQNLVPYEYKIMGQWIRENIKGIEDERIMARKAGVPFYAESGWHPLYYGDYPGLMDYLRSRGIGYLLIDEYTIPRLRPRFAFLLDEKKEHPGLEMMHAIDYKGRKTILYRVKEVK